MGVMASFFFFSRRRRHTRLTCDWSSDVCSSDLGEIAGDDGHQTGGSADLVNQVAVVIRSEERRVGKSVDLGGRRVIKKKQQRKRGSMSRVEVRPVARADTRSSVCTH